MKKKSQDLLDQITQIQDDIFSQGSTGNPPGLGPAQGTTTGGAQIATGQGSTSGQSSGLFGSLTPQQISQMLQGFGVPLDKEEQDEYDRLNLEHQAEIKKQKIAVFKKCSPDLRQFIVNFFTWKEVTQEINQVVVAKPERLEQLETKKKNNMFGSSKSHWHQSSFGTTGSKASWDPGMTESLLSQMGLPEGMTPEELKQAHIEATLEEEMLNVNEES